MASKDILASADRRTVEDRQYIADDSVALLRPLVHGIAKTFGRNCEVVLHDFRQPENSIIEIVGDVTHRHVGGSMSEIGLSIMAQGDAAENQHNYVTRTSDGRVVKATTMVLRDPDGHVFGALCINLDVTEMRLLSGMLDELVGSSSQPEPITFTNDVGQMIRTVIDEEEVNLGHPLDRLTKRERLAIMRALQRRGVFALQRAVPQVAEMLGVSRATIYTYLQEIHDQAEVEHVDSDQNGPGPRDGA